MRYIKNDSGIVKTYLGQELQNGEIYQIEFIQFNNWAEIARDTSSNLYTDINSGDLKVSNDNFITTLSASDGLYLIQAQDSNCIQGKIIQDIEPDNNDILKYNSINKKFEYHTYFGSEFSQSSSDVESTTTSTTFVQKLRHTTLNLPSGLYRIGYSCVLGNTDDKKYAEMQVQINDSITIGTCRVIGSYYSQSGIYYYNGSGILNIDLDYKCSETTAKIKEARIEVWRI